MDVVPHLLSLVAKDRILALFEIAFDEVTQKTVKFDASVIGAAETAPAQTAGGQSEITAIFLDHDIGGEF